MANVKFLRGLQASLPAQGAATDGAFYLTTDTNRLYVGQGTNLVELNKSITIVDVIKNPTSGQTALPTTGIAEGQFYYVKNDNILCVYENGSWTQINPDTNDDHVITGSTITFNKNASQSDTDKLVFDVAIPLQAYDYKGDAAATWSAMNIPSSIAGSLTINASEIANIVTNVDVSLSGSLSNSNSDLVLKNTGSGANTAEVKVRAGNNLTFSPASGNTPITLNAASYYMSAASNKIAIGTDDMLDPTLATSNVVTIAGGSGINVNTSSNIITVSHNAPASSPSGTYGSIANYTVSVPRITVDALGHITAVSTVSHKTNQVTGFSVNGTAIELTIDGDTQSKKVADLSSKFAEYYTSAQVDASISAMRQQLNGLTYKGKITTSATPTQSVSVGDMYLIANSQIAIAGTSPSQYYKEGDLIIAKGTEGSTGYITSPQWDRIQVDYDTDTTYTFGVASNANKMVIYSSTDDQNAAASFEFASNSLDVSKSSDGNAHTFNIDMTWGTF